MDGILAVGGFWLCMILLVMKKPMMTYIEKHKTQTVKEIEALREQVRHLESTVIAMGKELSDVRETSDFTHHLLTENANEAIESHRLLTEHSANAGAKTNSQKLIGVNGSHSINTSNSIKLISSDAVSADDLGKIINEHTVRFERVLPAPVERVWQYFTEPHYLSKWLAIGCVEPRVGGRVELNFDVDEMPERKEKGSRIRGLVNTYEPMSSLAFSWVDTDTSLHTTVSIELTPRGDQTAVVLTHSRLPKDRMHEFMAGWHTHFDVLRARLSNIMPPNFRQRFKQVVQTYAAVVATVVVSGAPAVAANPADADYQIIQTERSHLMQKYDLLWRDADSIQRQISLLRRDNSPESDRAVDRLDRQLQNEYRDLHDLELEIHDLDRASR
jgi:uncharacterized protein YndB with AHSA1/START domain